MSAFDQTVFWTAAKAAGMLKAASTILPGCTVPTLFDVDFRRPDVNVVGGARSTDYEIHYQYHDAPTLVEDAQVIVDGKMYRVREDPFIDPARGDDGFWRSAFITEVR